MTPLESAVDKCRRFGRARDRNVDREWRIVELSDDEAAAIADFFDEEESV